MSACCCGEINCPGWNQCRPASVSVQTSGALAYGYRDDGFDMSRSILNWDLSLGYFRPPTPQTGMQGVAPASVAIGFSVSVYTYTSGGLFTDPDCPPCKRRELALTITGSASSGVIAPPPQGFGAAHGIVCADPCFGLGLNAFSQLGVRLSCPFSFTRTQYFGAFPGIVNGGTTGILSLRFTGREGCLVPQTWDDYRIDVARLEMSILGEQLIIESDPNFANRCDCSSGCLPPALECVGLGSQNDGRLNVGQGWNRESCTEDVCVEQVCINPINGETISVCGCQTENSPYGPIGDNLDGLALRRYFEDLETTLVMGVP